MTNFRPHGVAERSVLIIMVTDLDAPHGGIMVRLLFISVLQLFAVRCINTVVSIQWQQFVDLVGVLQQRNDMNGGFRAASHPSSFNQ